LMTWPATGRPPPATGAARRRWMPPAGPLRYGDGAMSSAAMSAGSCCAAETRPGNAAGAALSNRPVNNSPGPTAGPLGGGCRCARPDLCTCTAGRRLLPDRNARRFQGRCVDLHDPALHGGCHVPASASGTGTGAAPARCSAQRARRISPPNCSARTAWASCGRPWSPPAAAGRLRRPARCFAMARGGDPNGLDTQNFGLWRKCRRERSACAERPWSCWCGQRLTDRTRVAPAGPALQPSPNAADTRRWCSGGAPAHVRSRAAAQVPRRLDDEALMRPIRGGRGVVPSLQESFCQTPRKRWPAHAVVASRHGLLMSSSTGIAATCAAL